MEGLTRITVHHATVRTGQGLDWSLVRGFIGATPCIPRIKVCRFPGSILLFLLVLNLLSKKRTANMFHLSRTIAVASLVSLLGHCSLATAQEPTSTDGELRVELSSA